MNGYGFSSQGVTADQWNNKTNSAVSKMEHTFWVTKQSVFRKFGKKEDECIVASDAELDAKLELFRSVQDTCSELQRILDKYQERLCNLAQEESAMGRFLKECSKRDQTNAGKAMISVGRALSYSGQQRLALRVPLQRLYHEVETFRQRAIEDTLLNVSAMERQRTEYRAALSWMKNISQELDPDTHKQLEKFRKVQGQVRQSKDNFDRLKLDCLQKVDLLAAARCNMFSHALTLYQQALIQHARRAQRAFGTVANDIKGYQHYEFCVVPELTEESSRLAKQSKENDKSREEEREDEKDRLLFFDSEYHDDKTESGQSSSQKQKSDSMQNLLNTGGEQGILPLIPLDLDDSISATELSGISTTDFLASDCLNQLQNILGNPLTDELPASVSEEWDTFFQKNDSSVSGGGFSSSEMPASATNRDGFLPSQLLDNFASSLKLELSNNPGGSNTITKDQAPTPSSAAATSELSLMSGLLANLRPPAAPPGQSTSLVSPTGSNQSPKTTNQTQCKTGSTNKKDMSAWYDLFADLDPLANPDALDCKTLEEERNC